MCGRKLTWKITLWLACHIVCKWLSLKQWRTCVAFYSSYNHKVGLMTLQANKKNQVTAQQDISLDV